LGDKRLLTACVNSIFSTTKQALDKTTSVHGFDEPRILKKACYLGILALKKGWDDVFTEVGLKIYEFEPLYITKYFDLPANINPDRLPIKKDQIFWELLRWRDNFNHELLNGNLRIRDDAEAMMYSLVQPIDIDRFMFEVWHKFPADSGLKEEWKLAALRKELIKLLKMQSLKTK
jgi:hypothetical protein